MKIQSLTGSVGYAGMIRENQDHDSSRQQSGQNHQNHDGDQEEAKKEEASYETVAQALESFKSDTQTLENGLTAEVIGDGPGLKVILSDGKGAVLRQFTGEEFVRLRGAAGKDQRSCGKILDQKL